MRQPEYGLHFCSTDQIVRIHLLAHQPQSRKVDKTKLHNEVPPGSTWPGGSFSKGAAPPFLASMHRPSTRIDPEAIIA